MSGLLELLPSFPVLILLVVAGAMISVGLELAGDEWQRRRDRHARERYLADYFRRGMRR